MITLELPRFGGAFLILRNPKKEVPMKKKVFIALGCLVLLAGAAGLWFKARLDSMYETFEAEEISHMDLSGIEDGTYTGEAGDFVVSVKLEVTVLDHRIESIEILEQKGGEGYEAHGVLPRIIEAQSPEVDVVSGATGSSRCIMIAVRNALLSADQ